MNRRQFHIAILSMALVLAGCSSVPKMLGGGKSFKLRPHQEVTLKNGLRVLLINDKGLPYYSMMLMLRTGSSADPANQAGLAQFVGSLLNKGTNKRDAIQLAESLEQIGANFGVSVDNDYTMISGSALSFHRDRFLADFSEMVTQPSFNNREIERQRGQILAGLTRIVDNPGQLANRAFERFVFGNHPYAHVPSGVVKDVKSIRKRHIIRFYLEHYRPNKAHLAVVGDFGDDIVARLEEAFGGWERRDSADVKIADAALAPNMEVTLIDKPDLEQTEIRMGHIGIARSDADFLTLRIANEIFGGSFSSRLMQKIRVERGLTYGIDSEFDSRLARGPFLISTFTRHDKVAETIQTTLALMKEIRDKGVTDAELETTKAYLKGVFPQALETAERLAHNMLLLRLYGIPDTYLTDYLNTIDRISKEQVNAALRRHFHPEKMKVLIFSSRSKVLPLLKDLGPVQVKGYSEFL